MDNWLTTVQIEEKYNLPPATLRRDLKRGKKFAESEYKKVGRDWLIDNVAAERVYKEYKRNVKRED